MAGAGLRAVAGVAPALGWQAIRDIALRRIQTGLWPPGAQIPTEAALAAELGCARATVNRALRDLAEAGYLDRRRRSGTRVLRHPVRKATLAIPVIRQEVAALGRLHDHVALRRRMGRPPAEVRAALGPGTPDRLLQITALHRADGAPHAHEDRWVNVEAVPAILGADLSAISANEWLVENVAYSHGRLALSAGVAGAGLAGHLGCAPGAAVFQLERTTWRHELPLTWVRMSYPPGHRLVTDI
ncbi:MAG: GntR family transcriptional regulator [Alkalilacustris sp.]